jgi:hypothetical protein
MIVFRYPSSHELGGESTRNCTLLQPWERRPWRIVPRRTPGNPLWVATGERIGGHWHYTYLPRLARGDVGSAAGPSAHQSTAARAGRTTARIAEYIPLTTAPAEIYAEGYASNNSRTVSEGIPCLVVPFRSAVSGD